MKYTSKEMFNHSVAEVAETVTEENGIEYAIECYRHILGECRMVAFSDMWEPENDRFCIKCERLLDGIESIFPAIASMKF